MTFFLSFLFFLTFFHPTCSLALTERQCHAPSTTFHIKWWENSGSSVFRGILCTQALTLCTWPSSFSLSTLFVCVIDSFLLLLSSLHHSGVLLSVSFPHSSRLTRPGASHHGLFWYSIQEKSYIYSHYNWAYIKPHTCTIFCIQNRLVFPFTG